MKLPALKIGLLIALLSITVVPTDSSAKGTRGSNGKHLAKGHSESGIAGQSFLFFGGCAVCDPVGYATTVLVYSEEEEFVTSVTTDKDGYFQVFLEPGTYIVRANTAPRPGPGDINFGYVDSWGVFVTVEKKQIAPAFVYSVLYIF